MDNALIHKISTYFTNQPIDKAWLFGSYARSEENAESDIDILVNFTPDAKVTLLTYVHIVNDLQVLTGKKIDMVEDGQLKQFARENAGDDKVLIYERKAEE
jgi:uncharacterized protein